MVFAPQRSPTDIVRFVLGPRFARSLAALSSVAVVANAGIVLARPTIRDAFFTIYPNAVGTTIETVPSHLNHCGQCHYDFSGGGPRNPYGVRLGQVIGNFPNNATGRQQAVISIENEDPDADGYSTRTEVTNTTTFTNTPTFGGLTPVNVGNVSNVSVTDIQGHLVPSTGGDTTPPSVTVIAPNGGGAYVANSSTLVQWSASDAGGIAAIDVYLSDDNGATYTPVAEGLANTGSHTWFPANRPTTAARIRVVATDNAFNTGSDTSNAAFTIASPPGGIAPTTLRDFDSPGSQPFEAGTLNDPSACAVCHGGYSASVEPYANWEGSMMSQASRDILFEACMAVANQDAPDSGDLCLRCHIPKAWLRGRSVPTSGSQVLASDMSGVSCDFCHRLVDPFYDPAVNPPEDADILASLTNPPSDSGNGMFVIDPVGTRRGPFVDATSGHAILVSPFHREAALCGTCHDVSNPAFQKDGQGNYVPNTFDAPPSSYSAHSLMPIERTYSEWFYSAYNTVQGVYAPEFAGNLAGGIVHTCQDCHLRDVTGKGCNAAQAPTRSNLPLHDMTGGSTWLPGLLGMLYPGEVNTTALQAGIARARYMLQNAADLSAAQTGTLLNVTVENNTGHKLPTGYPEGRRAWINLKFFDAGAALVKESAAYDSSTGAIAHDPEAKIYEAEPGLDSVTAPLVGVPEGPSFHFVLNNKIYKDNRIPPRGFANATFAEFGGLPVGYSYADGQYWDVTSYDVPPGATSARITLYYQSTSKEFVEFLRDENATNDRGQVLYDLWNNNGKCPPEVMRTMTIPLSPPEACCLPDGGCDLLDAATCAASGGTNHAGEYCSAVQACCFEDRTCNELDPICCLEQGGRPIGAVTDCTGFTCPACFVDTDCGDDNACTADSCAGGSCVNASTTPPGQCCNPANGTLTPIADGDACTDDVCQPTGVVTHPPAPAGTLCDDGALCTSGDQCDGGGACTGTPIPNCCLAHAECLDADLCDGSETCINNRCAAGTPLECDDNNLCTDDGCAPAVGCTHAPNSAACDDGVVCTTDTCVNGTCVGTSIPGCCQQDADCDDADVCDGMERCIDNDCVPGTPLVCNDGNPCNGLETCDPASGCRAGTITDCNNNQLDDSCDLASGGSFDCNGNTIPDECDIASGTSPDCQPNGVPDSCDLASGASSDDDANGVPDECDAACPPSAAPVAERWPDESGNPVVCVKNRTLSFTAGDPGRNQAIRVTLVDLPTPFDAWNDQVLYVGPPIAVCELGGVGPAGPCPAGTPTATFAPLSCQRVCRTDWNPWGMIHVFGEGVVPAAAYRIEVLDCDCDPADPAVASPPLSAATAGWGDVSGSFVNGYWTVPDGNVSVTSDVVAVLEKFGNRSGAPSKARADVEPASLDLKVNITDITRVLDGFRGLAYPFAPPGATPCPTAALAEGR